VSQRSNSLNQTDDALEFGLDANPAFQKASFHRESIILDTRFWPASIEPNAHSLPNMSDMNKLQFKGSWNEVKGKLRQKYAQLTDDELTYSEGKDDQLIGKF
jgi:hypothetical protein